MHAIATWFLAAALAAEPAASPLPVTPAGAALRAALDALDVERHWLPDQHIPDDGWMTGETDGKPGGPRTHCSAFVSAACWKLKAPMLNPPSQFLLANRQHDWLLRDGPAAGWREVPSPLAAQELANRGVVVVAAWKNPDAKKPGHVAMIRPAAVSPKAVAAAGPRIAQAGKTNANDTDVKTGFRNHPGAFERNEVRYFAHRPGGEPAPAVTAARPGTAAR